MDVWMQKSKLTEIKMARQAERKVKTMLIIFFKIKGNVYKEFILVGQTISCSYYCDVYSDCMNIYEYLAPNFGDKRLGCCIMTMHHRLTFQSPKATWLSSPKYLTCLTWLPMTFLCFADWKTRHFDTTEVIDAEPQMVLNTPREQTCRTPLMKGGNTGNSAYFACFEGDGGYQAQS
jgi:hypothetical protein